MSIADFFDKIKGSRTIDRTSVLYLFIVCGVGVASFGLGRLSDEQGPATRLGFVIYDNNSLNNTTQNNLSSNALRSVSPVTTSGNNFVASKNGKLYYSRGCTAAKRIKPTNEVWFKTASDAEKSGYTKSASCK
jgi:hypothetical protein